MKKIIGLSFVLIFGWVLILSCKPSGDDDVVIEGVVTDAKTGNPIDGANVEITAPAELRTFAKTDSSGKYSLSGIDIDEVTQITVTASAARYTDKSESVRIAPKDAIRNMNFRLNSSEVPSGGGDDGGDGVAGKPAGAAAIVLKGVQRDAINIKETGGIVNSSFTFEVQDSAGRALDLDNAVDVEFSILEGPGGGEGVQPVKVKTNDSGTVTSNLFAGNKAGPVMIQAKVTRSDIGISFVSRPVAITIHGGFPDLAHFSLAPDVHNFGGYDINGVENVISVIVGDKFSNPVKPGTAVYFETTGSVIQGSAVKHTNADGRVSVKLISADPRPNEAATVDGISMNGRPGLAKITARTIDENNNFIEKSTNVLLSTNSAFISANPTTFDLDPNGGATFDYTVTDLNGNPMPFGTRIKIEVGSGLEPTGAVDFTLGDYMFPGPGSTEFKFSIRDTDPDNDDPADATISITATTPLGKTTTYVGISGTRRKAF